jgi:hypothetical protein
VDYHGKSFIASSAEEQQASKFAAGLARIIAQ